MQFSTAITRQNSVTEIQIAIREVIVTGMRKVVKKLREL